MRFGVLLTTLSALPALAAQVVVSDVTWVRAAPVERPAKASIESVTRLELLVAPVVSTPSFDGVATAPTRVTLPIALAVAEAPVISPSLEGPCGMAVAYLLRARRQAT